jgi:hypothetical protein
MYRWHRQQGVVDADGRQVMQLVGGTNKFRNICGKLLVEKLNSIERGKEANRRREEAIARDGGKGEG